MALAPPMPCAWPACPNLVRPQRHVRGSYRCPEHPLPPRSYQEEDARRGSASERGYDHRWRKLRDAHLKKQPLCQRCIVDGVIKPADLVDHIVALNDGGPRLDPRNLSSLCEAHHAQKTREEIFRRAERARQAELEGK